MGKIKTERGLTHQQLLWEESWANLMLEALDQPWYDPHPKAEREVKEGLGGILSELRR